MPGDQDRLIEAVAAANPRTIVVLNTDGPVATAWLNDVEAVVQAWCGGRGAGTALAPSCSATATRPPPGDLPRRRHPGPGTTPATYPGTNGTVAYDEGIAVGYRFYGARKQEPRFPFGHGLSCTTTFAHGSMEATYDAAARQGTVEVTATNTGLRRGTEVLQVYATLPASAAAEPRRLVAFQKVTLPAAGAKRLSLTIPVEDLTVWKPGTMTLTPGVHTFATARSSRVVTAQRATSRSADLRRQRKSGWLILV
ncbi:glycoside hydrolase family 3 C-terminal domain-containing protein [Streptomyces griseoloalbus]|uniref:glycoside hydrolase family 3 C-terminal domain-containing protein n=1 Tax=Streptomyces griseoloalbus TaxID=67303 RepID=UPI0033A0BE95